LTSQIVLVTLNTGRSSDTAHESLCVIDQVKKFSSQLS